MTMLRNPLSVSRSATSATSISSALASSGVGEEQRNKARKAAERLFKLQSGSRAERNRANVEYTWESGGGTEQEDKNSIVKRAREQKLRSKAARGLGNGIQFPDNLCDNVDLIMLNYKNLPSKVPEKPRPDPAKTLEWLSEAISTSGRSLRQENGLWYERGGKGWTMSSDPETGATTFDFDFEFDTSDENENENQNQNQNQNQNESEKSRAKKIWDGQTRKAASDAFSRLVASGRSNNSLRDKFQGVLAEQGESNVDLSAANSASTGALGMSFGGVWGDGMENLRDSISARLAWMLEGVEPRGELELAKRIDAITEMEMKKEMEKEKEKEKEKDDKDKDKDDKSNNDNNNDDNNNNDNNDNNDNNPTTTTSDKSLRTKNPLVSASLAFEVLSVSSGKRFKNKSKLTDGKLGSRVLYEAYADSLADPSKFESALDAITSSVERFGRLKLSDDTSNRVFQGSATTLLANHVSTVPNMTPKGVDNLCKICDIREAEKSWKEAEANRKKLTKKDVARAKANYESSKKRATQSLKVIKSLCVHRTSGPVVEMCVSRLVGLCGGRIPSGEEVRELCLKIICGTKAQTSLFQESEELEAMFVRAAGEEMRIASEYCNSRSQEILEENEKTIRELEDEMRDEGVKPPTFKEYDLVSELEKEVYKSRCFPLVRVVCGLCVKTPSTSPDTLFTLVESLFSGATAPGAGTLFKAVETNLGTFASKAGKKFGEAEAVKRVAEFTKDEAVPLLLRFMEEIVPVKVNQTVPTSFIEACKEVRGKMGEGDDVRFLLPIMGCISRGELVEMLPRFILEGDAVLLSASRKMSERLPRHKATYRDAASTEGSLVGMTGCEQFVEMCNLDFSKHGIEQKAYLSSFNALFEDSLFSDTVVQSSLSVIFTNYVKYKPKPLPLAFMRMVLKAIIKHVSLYSYICNDLLPKLVAEQLWAGTADDKRQWQGVCRALGDLFPTEGNPNLRHHNSVGAIMRLPIDQFTKFLTPRPQIREQLAVMMQQGQLGMELDMKKKNFLLQR